MVPTMATIRWPNFLKRPVEIGEAANMIPKPRPPIHPAKKFKKEHFMHVVSKRDLFVQNVSCIGVNHIFFCIHLFTLSYFLFTPKGLLSFFLHVDSIDGFLMIFKDPFKVMEVLWRTVLYNTQHGHCSSKGSWPLCESSDFVVVHI